MNEEIHIGTLIWEKLKEDGRTASWLAKQIHCTRPNIYKIFEKANIDAIQLLQICVVLEFDFFTHYSIAVHKGIQKKQQKVANLDTECNNNGNSRISHNTNS